MAQQSAIEWTDATHNHWIGCTHVSPGCTNCYAETMMDKRWGKVQWGKGKPRMLTSAANRRKPLLWNRACAIDGTRMRVFSASLSDWLDEEVPIGWLVDLLGLIERTPHLDWLLLSKRIKAWGERLHQVVRETHDGVDMFASRWLDGDAPANVWVGTSVEDQRRADERIPHLLDVPARVRFLSCEPLLGPIDLLKPLVPSDEAWECVNELQERNDDCYEPEEFIEECEAESDWVNYGQRLVINPEHREWESWRLWRAKLFELENGIHWVIAGGESGHGARPYHPVWARSLREQCATAGVAFFWKQHGEWAPVEVVPDLASDRNTVIIDPDGSVRKDGAVGFGHVMARVGKHAAGRLLDGREWNEYPEVQS